jgi:hypothetical protein
MLPPPSIIWLEEIVFQRSGGSLRFLVGVTSFFIGGFEPLAFWDCLFLGWRSFVLSLLHFRIASFFVGGLCF